jgi:serine/threonine-protein kinase
MEYLTGGSLEELLKRESRLPIGQSVKIAYQIASALAYIHSLGVIHMDVKPKNILFRRRRAFLRSNRFQVVLCDFGLARGFGYPPPLRKSGTLDYMSPEQFQETHNPSQSVDSRSDIFSLGVVLYQMLTGQLPFEDAGMLLHQDPPTSPSILNPRVPKQLEAIMMRCLAKELHQRYQSALELEHELATLPLPSGWSLTGLYRIIG